MTPILPLVPDVQGFYVMGEDGRWQASADVPLRRFAASRYGLLLSDVAYRTASGDLLVARKGLIFDGGSKPAVTWPLFGNPWGAYLAAYTIHDSECATIERLLADRIITRREARRLRKTADRLFREASEWIQREILHSSSSRMESIKNRIKFRVVRLHAWWTLKRKHARVEGK
jgi:hypothetical protein